MSEAIVLKHDLARSSRPNTFSAVAVTPSMFKVEAFIRYASGGPVFRCHLYVHEKLPGGGRRRDPEGAPALLMSRLNETDWAVENCRATRSAPMSSFVLQGWVPPREAP